METQKINPKFSRIKRKTKKKKNSENFNVSQKKIRIIKISKKRKRKKPKDTEKRGSVFKYLKSYNTKLKKPKNEEIGKKKPKKKRMVKINLKNISNKSTTLRLVRKKKKRMHKLNKRRSFTPTFGSKSSRIARRILTARQSTPKQKFSYSFNNRIHPKKGFKVKKKVEKPSRNKKRKKKSFSGTFFFNRFKESRLHISKPKGSKKFGKEGRIFLKVLEIKEKQQVLKERIIQIQSSNELLRTALLKKDGLLEKILYDQEQLKREYKKYNNTYMKKYQTAINKQSIIFNDLKKTINNIPGLKETYDYTQTNYDSFFLQEKNPVLQEIKDYDDMRKGSSTGASTFAFLKEKFKDVSFVDYMYQKECAGSLLDHSIKFLEKELKSKEYIKKQKERNFTQLVNKIDSSKLQRNDEYQIRKSIDENHYLIRKLKEKRNEYSELFKHAALQSKTIGDLTKKKENLLDAKKKYEETQNISQELDEQISYMDQNSELINHRSTILEKEISRIDDNFIERSNTKFMENLENVKLTLLKKYRIQEEKLSRCNITLKSQQKQINMYEKKMKKLDRALQKPMYFKTIDLSLDEDEAMELNEDKILEEYDVNDTQIESFQPLKFLLEKGKLKPQKRTIVSLSLFRKKLKEIKGSRKVILQNKKKLKQLEKQFEVLEQKLHFFINKNKKLTSIKKKTKRKNKRKSPNSIPSQNKELEKLKFLIDEKKSLFGMKEKVYKDKIKILKLQLLKNKISKV